MADRVKLIAESSINTLQTGQERHYIQIDREVDEIKILRCIVYLNLVTKYSNIQIYTLILLSAG